jgi:hypothetical protein
MAGSSEVPRSHGNVIRPHQFGLLIFRRGSSCTYSIRRKRDDSLTQARSIFHAGIGIKISPIYCTINLQYHNERTPTDLRVAIISAESGTIPDD